MEPARRRGRYRQFEYKEDERPVPRRTLRRHFDPTLSKVGGKVIKKRSSKRLQGCITTDKCKQIERQLKDNQCCNQLQELASGVRKPGSTNSSFPLEREENLSDGNMLQGNLYDGNTMAEEGLTTDESGDEDADNDMMQGNLCDGNTMTEEGLSADESGDEDADNDEEEFARQLNDIEEETGEAERETMEAGEREAEEEETAKEDEEMEEEMEEEEEEEEVTDFQLNMTISQKVKLLLLLATKKRHNLSYPAAEDMMKLAGLISKEAFPFRPSKHLMKKAIETYSSSLSIHHMCPDCKRYIGVVQEQSFNCPTCQIEISTEANKRGGNIFLYLSLQDQLRSLLEYELSEEDFVSTSNRLKINKYNYEDIHDGKIYRTTVPHGSLSFNFFIDGLQVATTSKKSAWPVLLSINELRSQLRQKHILMTSIWLGLKKPVMNEYLKPFQMECAQLAENGMTYSRNSIEKIILVKPLMGVCDSVARPLVRNSSQFNGRYGCGLCYHPGIRVRRLRGHCRAYPTRNYSLRTHQETIDLANLAEETGRTQRGIKGRSIITNLRDDFDIVRGLDLDLFHVLVNTAKRFSTLWFASSKEAKKLPFNISDKLSEVDARLVGITPSSNVSRAPRSLTERSDYRGHEWYYWIVMYSIPCLKDILPQKYLHHWSLLVSALALLMQNSVAKSDLVYADRYLQKFVLEMEELYKVENVTFSIHLLTHLKKSVEDYGQPWTHSAFIYESFNGEIKNAVKSSNGAAKQICTSMQLKEAIRKLKIEVYSFMTDEEREYFDNVTSNAKQLALPSLILGPAHLLGKAKSLHLPENASRALRRINVLNLPQIVDEYHRCKLNGELLHSVKYSRTTKQNNSVVLLNDDNIFEIDSFIVVSDTCYVLGLYLEKSNRKLCDNAPPHILVLEERHDTILRCIPLTSVQCKVLSFFVKLANGQKMRLACINVLKSEMLR